jgi:Holliday junction resolvase RusA-like endonuclease
LELLIIKIPQLPPKEYNQNWRGGWRQKAAAGKLYKQIVVSELPRSNWEDIGPLASARMKVIYHVKENRRRDQDNHIARLKPAIDGLVASGLFLDDEHISIIEPVIFEKTTNEPWLELQLVYYRKALESSTNQA